LEQKLPPALLESLRSIKDLDVDAFIAVHEKNDPPVSIRLNPFKSSTAFANEEKISWCESGRYLKSRPSFTIDPLFQAGCYYVQEASSMFIEYVIKQVVDITKPIRVLDLCAAPGGKSTLIASLLSEESLLIANEVIKTRVNILSENLVKWGNSNVFITNNDPADFARLKNYFDVILVDAPCSGSGLFRKDPDAIKEWSEENVNTCWQRQQRILTDVIPSLKENGILIYSTCSYSKNENEEMADWMVENLSLENVKISLKEQMGIVESFSVKHKAQGFRFYPHKLKGEGFYCSCFRKTSGEEIPKMKQASFKTISSSEKNILEKWVKDPKQYIFFKHEEDILAIRNEHEKDLPFIQQNLYLRKAGIKIGRIMNSELIPDHQLAMSLMMNDSIPKINVDKETALKYLKREDLKMPEAKIGWTLICFEKHPLGWAKILPNRVNNYFPKELRILKRIEEF